MLLCLQITATARIQTAAPVPHLAQALQRRLAIKCICPHQQRARMPLLALRPAIIRTSTISRAPTMEQIRRHSTGDSTSSHMGHNTNIRNLHNRINIMQALHRSHTPKDKHHKKETYEMFQFSSKAAASRWTARQLRHRKLPRHRKLLHHRKRLQNPDQSHWTKSHLHQINQYPVLNLHLITNNNQINSIPVSISHPAWVTLSTQVSFYLLICVLFCRK